MELDPVIGKVKNLAAPIMVLMLRGTPLQILIASRKKIQCCESNALNQIVWSKFAAKRDSSHSWIHVKSKLFK